MHKVSSSTDFCILGIMLFLMGCMIRRKQMALVLAISSLLPIFLIKLQCTFRHSEHKGPLICADLFLPISSLKCFHLWLQDGPEMQITISWSSTSGKYCCVLYSQLHAVRAGYLLLAMGHVWGYVDLQYTEVSLPRVGYSALSFLERAA